LIGLAVLAMLVIDGAVFSSAAFGAVAGAPTGLVRTPGNAQVALSWTAPASNGGNAITDYRVQFKLTSASTWTTFTDGVSTARTATVTGLSNGSGYSFQVAAINASGTGAYSSVGTATPRTVPGAPTGLTGSAGNTLVALSWTAPSSNGGAAITDYRVQYKVTAGGTWTTFTEAVSTTPTASVTGLTNGSGYSFQVAAINAAGVGAYSSAAAGTPRTVAGAPGTVTGTPGNAQVALSWAAPASNGGAEVTDYRVEVKPSGGSWATVADGVSVATAATVTGLTNGTDYFFQVAAINVAGTSAYATSGSITPRTVPGAPTALDVTPGSGQVALSWTAPASHGGSTVTDYEVQTKPSAGGAWTTFADGVSTATSVTVTGLANGTSYDVRVAAVNGAGTGSPSGVSSSMPRTTPGAPTGLVVTAGDGQASLEWVPPGSDGGAAVTSYRVSYYPTAQGAGSASTLDTGSTAVSVTVTGLTIGTGYTFIVAASNVAGLGMASEAAAATPRTVPAAPTGLSAAADAAQVLLTWTAPAGTGGAPISDYRVEYKATSGSQDWTTFPHAASTATTATITGLGGGTYDLRVSAVNEAGTGAAASTVAVVPVPAAQPARWSATIAMDAAQVTTVAGNDTQARVDGSGSAAGFVEPKALHVVSADAYVSDSGSLRKVSLSTGAVTTVAGTGSIWSGCGDSTNPTSAGTPSIQSLTDDGSYLFWLDDCPGSTFAVRRMALATRAISTITSFSYLNGGDNSNAALTTGPDGVLYVSVDATISRVNTATGVLSPVATLPAGLTGSGAGRVGYLAADDELLWAVVFGPCSASESARNCRAIVSIDPGTGVTQLLPGSAGRYDEVSGLAQRGPLVSAGEYLYAAGNHANRVLRFAKATGERTSIAGANARYVPSSEPGGPNYGYADGVGAQAWLGSVSGLDSDGTNLWITDREYNRVRKLTAAAPLPATQPARWSQTLNQTWSSVEIIAGGGANNGSIVDGVGRAAGFAAPTGIVVEGSAAYIADNGKMRRLDLGTGQVTSVAGNGGTTSAVDHVDPNLAGISTARSLTSDGTFVYFADYLGNVNRIRRMLLATGAVSTVAYVPMTNTATFMNVTIGPGGALYASSQSAVYRIDKNIGTLTTIASFPAPSGDFGYTLSLAADATSLWVGADRWCAAASSTCDFIARIDPATGTVTQLDGASWSSSDERLGEQSLVSAGDYLYATAALTTRDASGGNTQYYTGVYRYAKDGSGVTLIALLDQGSWGIDVSGSAIYVVQAGRQRVLKLTQAPATGAVGQASCGGGSITLLKHGLRSCGFPIDLDSGAQFENQTDLSVPGRGAGLDLTRTYDTRRRGIAGRFGHGWNDSYDWRLTENTTTDRITGGQVSIREGNGAITTFTPNRVGGYTAPTRVLATLTGNRTDGWIFTVRQNLTHTFSPAGKLISVKDRNGYTTTPAYDASGRLSTVTDEAGRSLTFDYDTTGRVKTVTDPLQRTATYTYSSAGDLSDVQITSPTITGTAANGGSRTWHFDYTDHLLTGMRDPRGKTVTTTYDTAGRATTQTDRAGNLTTYDYGTLGDQGSHTTTVTHPAGNIGAYSYRNGLVISQTIGAGTSGALTTRYEYDALTSGLISVIDNAGNETTTTYDAHGNVLSVRDPLGRITATTYNQFGQPLSITDPTGVITTNTYDARGNLQTVTRPLVTPQTSFGPPTSTTVTTTLTYGDPAHPGDITATQDPELKSTTYEYDAYGNRTKVSDPTGRATSTTHNQLGWVTSVTSPAGNMNGATAEEKAAHTINYSDFTITGQPRVADGPLPQDTSHTVYDANGNATDVTDAEDRHVQTTYDGENRPLVVALNGTTTSEADYNANGNLWHSRNGLGHETSYEYDALNRVTAIHDPLHHTTSYGYDAAGRRSSVTTGSNRTSITVYDAAGQATASSDAEGRTLTYAYDDAGRLTTSTDETGRVSATVYDSFGRKVASQAGHLSGTTPQLTTAAEWAYDANGNLLISRDGTGKDTTYTYDDAGRVLTSSDPLDRVTGYGYDIDGNGSTLTRPAPTGGGILTTTSGYDAAGRLTTVDYPAGTPDVSYGYDRTGRRTSMTDGTGTTTYTYNDRGQLSGTLHSDGTGVGYGYDAAGRQTTISYPGAQTLTRTYDDADNLHTVTDWADRTTTYTWDNDDALQSIALPNGVTTSHGHDQSGLTTGITTGLAAPGGSTTPVVHLGYQYDQAGLLRTATDATDPATPIIQTYSWDDRGRLDSLTGGTAPGDYAFDAADHITTHPGANFTVDDAGQLTNSNTPAQGGNPATTSTHTYDTHGNRTTAHTTTTGGTTATSLYAYDAADRLTNYTSPTGATTGYGYDGDGLRSTNVTGETTSRYTWDTSGNLPLLLADADNWYLYGHNGHPYAQIHRTTGNITYLHADATGSTRATTNTSGTRTATWDYTPYGTISTHTGDDTTPFLYAGEYRDSTSGLYYLRARYYDPTTATFLTRDPLEATTGLAYGYTNGNPLQYGDPTGECSALNWARSFTIDVGSAVSHCSMEDSTLRATDAARASVAALKSRAENLVDGFIGGTVNECGFVGGLEERLHRAGGDFVDETRRYDYGTAAATIVNVAYGGWSVYVGYGAYRAIPICALGGPGLVAACATVAVYKVGSGGARALRGVRQGVKWFQGDNRYCMQDCDFRGNGGRFVRGITPQFGAHWLDLWGGLI
jgi:RHS repeat-associated protein